MSNFETDSPVTLPRSLSRRIFAGNGREYTVLVAWPSEPPPPGGYPSIYVLDPHTSFATTVECLRTRTPRAAATNVKPAVVIGIGYPTPDLQDRARRTFDFTPADMRNENHDDQEEQPHGAEPASGGGEQFLQTILGPITDAVTANFPLASDQRTVVGHSLGGLFVVSTLLTKPDAFRTYVAASPSIWWAPRAIMRAAASLGDRVDPSNPIRVLLTVGEYEQRLAPWQTSSTEAESARARRSLRRMVDRVHELARGLAALTADGHRIEHIVWPEEDHASVLPMTISRALRTGLGD